jgi:hypothetical protein
LDVLSIELRADSSTGYRVLAERADGGLDEIWIALEQVGSTGVSVRRSPPLRLHEPSQALYVLARLQRESAPIPEISLIAPRLAVPHAVLIPALWLAFIALFWASRARPVDSSAERALAAWVRIDLPLATVLIYLVLFRLGPPGWVGIAAALSIAAGVALARRAPAATAALLVSAAVIATVLPRALTAIVVAKVSEQFDLTVDHRPKPNGQNINSDGLRFDGEAESLHAEDFVVLFLGDSFTFGTRLRDPHTYPKAVERLANTHSCSQRIQTVNFGWPSASPLLSLRLLRRIGFAYQPDLVVYSLDMTDFLDDLRYERALRNADEFEVDTTRVVQQLVDRFAPWLHADLASGSALRALLRPGRPHAVGGEPELPTDRFFVTNAPLDETRHWIEAGVMKNLTEIQHFSAETLEVPMALVLYPRSYQYPNDESPASWERHEYDPNGPFVREPFRYFHEVAPELPYPVIDLMTTFEEADEEPLFLVDDPHWNRAGARLAADAVVRELMKLDLLPCDAD